MRLFIKDEPFSLVSDPSDIDEREEIRVWISLTRPDLGHLPASVKPREFIIDTGADYGCDFANDMAYFGLGGLDGSVGRTDVTLWDGTERPNLPITDVRVWLHSNLPEYAEIPHGMDVVGGVVNLPSQPVAGMKPLIGMKTMKDGGLILEVNFQTRTYSIWVPEDGTQTFD